MDIKQILWAEKPRSFKEFQKIHQKQFVACLKIWLNKNQILKKEFFELYYQILFYHGFINYKKEVDLFQKLKKAGFVVEATNLKMDAIFQIDLIAKNSNFIFYIQVKPDFKNLSQNSQLKIKNLSLKHNITPLLAIKRGKEWKLFNILNGSKLKLF